MCGFGFWEVKMNENNRDAAIKRYVRIRNGVRKALSMSGDRRVCEFLRLASQAEQAHLFLVRKGPPFYIKLKTLRLNGVNGMTPGEWVVAALRLLARGGAIYAVNMPPNPVLWFIDTVLLAMLRDTSSAWYVGPEKALLSA